MHVLVQHPILFAEPLDIQLCLPRLQQEFSVRQAQGLLLFLQGVDFVVERTDGLDIFADVDLEFLPFLAQRVVLSLKHLQLLGQRLVRLLMFSHQL
jgi:hypothetical protein